MITFFERQHNQAEAKIEASRLGELQVGAKAEGEIELLWLATWAMTPPVRLYALIVGASNSECYWFVGAMAMQNPNINLLYLERFMKQGRQRYWLYGKKHNPYGTNGLHWLYEAGLKNPLLQLLDWEHPGSLADFLARVDSREEN